MVEIGGYHSVMAVFGLTDGFSGDLKYDPKGDFNVQFFLCYNLRLQCVLKQKYFYILYLCMTKFLLIVCIFGHD